MAVAKDEFGEESVGSLFTDPASGPIIGGFSAADDDDTLMMGVPSGLDEEELNWEDQVASQSGGCDCGTVPDPRQQYTTEIPHTCWQSIVYARSQSSLKCP